MKILAIDTSTRHYSLALLKDGKVAVHRSVQLKRLLEDSIIPSIDALLKKSKISLGDLDGFAVGLGPGSFTSLRVGLASVKGFCLATEKPVVGIPSLDTLSMNALKERGFVGQICVLCDAKRSLVYTCLYETREGTLKKLTDYMLCPIGDILKKIKKPTFFIGDGIQLFKKDIETFARKASLSVAFAVEKDWYPKAEALARLAEKRFKDKKFDNIDSLIPLYLYPDDCQVSLK